MKSSRAHVRARVEVDPEVTMRAAAAVGIAAVLAVGLARVATPANDATVTGVDVMPKVNRTNGTHYLSVAFTLHVDEYITSKKSLQINAHCKEPRSLRTDEFTGISVRGLHRGDVKKGTTSLFNTERVRGELDNCRLRFELHELGKKYFDKGIGTFCYRGGRVTSGDCD
jgi:hypothetical protein